MILRIIDCETCGFPPDNRQVVEIAAVDLWRATGETPRTPGSAAASGRRSSIRAGRSRQRRPGTITSATTWVKDAPKIKELHEEIVRGLDGGHLCAHEAKFEKACLPQFAPLITICTRKCAATLWPDAPDHKNQTMRYWLGLKLSDPALATPHRAAGDAYVTAALLGSRPARRR
jgi:exodeoxyribonuclease X